jgi:hypothetical protein
MAVKQIENYLFTLDDLFVFGGQYCATEANPLFGLTVVFSGPPPWRVLFRPNGCTAATIFPGRGHGGYMRLNEPLSRGDREHVFCSAPCAWGNCCRNR